MNWLEKHNIVRDSPSRDSSGSMPLGSGDIGVNVCAVEFKLHAPLGAVAEGAYNAGKVEHLKVTPTARSKDVVLHA